MPPSEIDTHVVRSLADAVASVPHFDVTCGSTKWFGSDMLWLDPQPVDCFRALTRVVLRTFPAHLPYGGAHDEVIPHLTVGHDASESQLLEAERQILHHLPIVASVRSASLWCGTDAPGSWRPFATLPLG